MRIRIVTFGLNIPADDYTAHAFHIAREFTAWPGLLGKWWLADPASGTFGGVYLFASQRDADRSRGTELFRGMDADPALKDLTVREYDLLDRPADAELEALVRVATAVADVPNATVNLIDSEYQCQLAAVGFEGRRTPRSDSMCAVHFRSGRTIHLRDAQDSDDYRVHLAVTVDDERGAAIAVEHLASLGHREVVHLGGPEGWTEADQRITGANHLVVLD